MAGFVLKVQKKLRGRPKGHGSQFVYERLRERIVRMEIEPGSYLDELRLVDEFGVSRTPIREAIIRLASENLVVMLPNRGAQVAPLDMEELREFFEAFDLFQRAVNHWSAKRRTEDQVAIMRRQAAAFRAAHADGDITTMVDTNINILDPK